MFKFHVDFVDSEILFASQGIVCFCYINKSAGWHSFHGFKVGSLLSPLPSVDACVQFFFSPCFNIISFLILISWQDTEAYKGMVKEDMMRWQNSLRVHGSADWVIIVVESNDNKKKNKTNILPRSSIVDKIRSDFCNKQNDR